MQTLRFQHTSTMPVSPEALLAWHESAGAFVRLTPPWEPVSLEQAPASLSGGAVAKLRLQTPIPGLRLLWVAEHERWQEGLGFVDTQAKSQGPFAYWRHEHRCLPVNATTEQSLLQDSIRYNLPLEPMSRPFGQPVVQLKLERMFRYRHAITYADLKRHQQAKLPPQLILVCGSSGLVGTALCAFLRGGGHRVVQLLRPSSPVPVGVAPSDVLHWQPESSDSPDWSKLEEKLGRPVDAVLNLCGVSVAQSTHWTTSFKQQLWNSRVEVTETLVKAITTLATPPKVLLSASGLGAYNDAKSSYLAKLAHAWEAAAYKAETKGTRVCTLRIGLVLDAKSGFLKAMASPMRWGAGIQLGADDALLSWIALEDVLGSLLHLIATPTVSGAVVLASPSPVSRKGLLQTLAYVMQRPLWGSLPNGLCQLMMGEFAKEVLLASYNVKPDELIHSGFNFLLPELEATFRHTLGCFTPEEALLGV
jgi:uncharacterized protein